MVDLGPVQHKELRFKEALDTLFDRLAQRLVLMLLCEGREQ